MSNEAPKLKTAGVAPANRPRLAFMDAVEAAANLKTDRLGVLNLIQEGKLRTFGGKQSNPFVRTEDVDKLARELQLFEEQETPPDPRAVHRSDPVRKLKLRLQQDAKWHEVDRAAMQAWAAELDLISYERMRQVARDAISQLQMLIIVLDEGEAGRKRITGR